MAAKKPFSPQNLKVLLGALLIIVVLGGAGLFYVGLDMVKQFAVEVNHKTQDAKASAAQIQELQLLRTQIKEGGSLITKANQLQAASDTYQSQVLTDLSAYAERSGVKIDGTEFGDPSQDGKHIATVKLKNPVSYAGLIRFLDNIESNVPKLQVTSIQLSHTTTNPGSNVTVGEIKIEIMTR